MLKKILIICIFFLLLLTPKILILGASSGLVLWYKSLIPALMPFMFLSSLIINLDLTSGINLFMRPITKLLYLPKNTGYPIFAGLFFGYPACALTSIELYKNHMLDKTSAQICICAFNNVSPAFICGYVCPAIIKEPKYIITVLTIQYLTVLLNGIIIRYIFFKRWKPTYNTEVDSLPKNDRNILDTALTNAIINITKLGGYIIIFSIIATYIQNYLNKIALIPGLLIEITSGLSFVKNNNLLLILPFMYWGGICGFFQTFAADSEGIIPKKKYILYKTIGAIISFLLCVCIKNETVIVFFTR